MSGSGKGLLGLWLYRSGEQEWAVKEGSPLHKPDERLVIICEKNRKETFSIIFFPLRQRNHFQREERAKIATEKVSPGDKTSIIFTLNNQVGGLARALQVFQELGINVLHLELQNSNVDVEQVG